MAAILSPPGVPGLRAPDFLLPDAVSGETISLADVRGTEGTLVMFLSAACPHVTAIVDRLVRDAHELESLGVRAVAIMPNDVAASPDDAPERMAAFAARHRFPFPYLHDESQAVARAYGAVCTPDLFGFDRGLRLVYRGRLDAPDAPRELFAAMAAAAHSREAPAAQHPALGCPIAWRGGA